MRKYHLFLGLISCTLSFGQVGSRDKFVLAKEFSKEMSLFVSKQFLFTDVLKIEGDPTPFEIIPLAAASSGELTTLLYKCDKKNMEGLVLCFYGDYWNPAGVVYQGYAFKNFNAEKATDFLNKIQSALDQYSKFIRSDSENNNVVLKYDDVDALISSNNMGAIQIRLFWNNFDSSWDKTAFDRSKRRFEKQLAKQP